MILLMHGFIGIYTETLSATRDKNKEAHRVYRRIELFTFGIMLYSIRMIPVFNTAKQLI
jgi:hypothetical protein